ATASPFRRRAYSSQRLSGTPSVASNTRRDLLSARVRTASHRKDRGMEPISINHSLALERKWLFDHANAPRAKTATAADDGDLIKAAGEAAGIRANHPAAKFIVYLCTNRRLDTDLMRPVYDKAGRLGVEVRFLDQSRLR